MSESVAELFVRMAQLAVAEEDPAPETGIDGVWTTTVPAPNRESDWNVAMNCDTGTEHTVEDFPAEGDTPSLRAGSVTVWLGTVPAGVCTPFSGTVVVQETLDGPTSIEDELIADIEQQIEAIDGDREEALPTTGGEPP